MKRFWPRSAIGLASIELVYREVSLAAHCDRKDKRLSGQIYIAGDPKGTELFDASGKRAGLIEWQPNRMACWTRPAMNQKHAAPESSGRYVLLWWILGNKAKRNQL